MTRTEIAEAVRSERAKLVADLRTLGPQAWDSPSLCKDWNVRDVVAHVIRVGHFYSRPYTFEWDIIRFGFRLNHALAQRAKLMAADRSPEQLLDELERSAYEDTLVFRLHPQPLFALAEWIVHGQDIRRPLGIEATFDPTHLKLIGDVSTKWYTWGARQRRRSQRLEATDADYATGEGPVLRGPLEAVVMTLFGREAALRDLTPQT